MTDVAAERRQRFAELYDANYELIRSYARRRADQAAEAEDVVAETFLIAWRRLDALKPGQEVRPWLYAVARRVLANQRRASRRRGALSDRIQQEGQRSRANSVEHERLAALEAALACLSESDREVIGLAYWEELSPGEIAIVLGCSQNAARIRLHRARRRLERALDATPARSSSPSHSAQAATMACTKETP